MDAAEHVIKSKKDLRQILIEFDQSAGSANGSSSVKKQRLFGNGQVVKVGSDCAIYEDLGDDGTAMVMNIEMNKEQAATEQSTAATKKSSTANKQNGKLGNGTNATAKYGKGSTIVSTKGKKLKK